jgi:hypothetical protein
MYVWWWNMEARECGEDYKEQRLRSMPKHPSMEKWKAKDSWQKLNVREIEGRKR